ncbi:adenylyltransferase/cytidyltransferase family protein [Acidobacteria bacterium AH-259-O06]|nr:adenylyltransferase/cytidyltransferase family protein [Acidobacteria bacterium AH-259-O06]
MKKVLVSGCFDLLHAGHIAFLKEASAFGELHVRVGSDENIKALKGKLPMFSQEERVYVLNSINCVAGAAAAGGRGMLDFEPDMEELRPDIFVVNEDGHTDGKAELCRKYNVEYKVLKRIPPADLMARSSSDTKERMELPYRVCLAGGWVDQPWVSAIHPGSVVVVSLEPTHWFNDRSGMATSTRKRAQQIWGQRFPAHDYEQTAKLLFAFENPPGTKYVSGSQDHIGLVYPGISRLDYDGDYWPERIESTSEPETVTWLQSVLYFVPLAPRPAGYDPLKEKHLELEPVRQLGQSGKDCWNAIVSRDVAKLGQALSRTVDCWRKILPYTVNEDILREMDKYASHAGANFSGSGGGYIIVVSGKPVEGGFQINIRVAED